MKKNVIKGTSICVLLFLVTATNLMAQHICCLLYTSDAADE